MLATGTLGRRAGKRGPLRAHAPPPEVFNIIGFSFMQIHVFTTRYYKTVQKRDILSLVLRMAPRKRENKKTVKLGMHEPTIRAFT